MTEDLTGKPTRLHKYSHPKICYNLNTQARDHKFQEHFHYFYSILLSGNFFTIYWIIFDENKLRFNFTIFGLLTNQ